MNDSMILLIVIVGLEAVAVAGLIALLVRKPKTDTTALDQQLAPLKDAQARVEERVAGEIARFREESGKSSAQQRQEIGESVKAFGDTLGKQLVSFTQINEQRMEKVRETLDAQLKFLQQENAKKLDEMRKTVDEKLQTTLETRLGESFKQVSERLEKVHQGLGEMQTLAAGVGDLKRILSNVKTRGVFGETQLGRIIEEILTPEQYEKNVVTKAGSRDPVEFAVRLPGRGGEGEKPILLPIDAKFPVEDYQRLVDAYEAGNADEIVVQQNKLRATIQTQASFISDKYIDPPNTTDFAIMFLATESLFAEVLRLPGLLEFLQRKFRVTVTGPTTLAAILNSLQMGFRTLAIEKRTSEIWELLGAVKTNFGKFGDVLDKVHKKLQEAGHTIEDAQKKQRTITRSLRKVEALPADKAEALLPDMDIPVEGEEDASS